MKKITVVLLLTMLFTQSGFQQTVAPVLIGDCHRLGTGICSKSHTTACAGAMQFAKVNPKWSPSLQHIFAGNLFENPQKIAAIKAQMSKIKYAHSGNGNNQADRTQNITSDSSAAQYAGMWNLDTVIPGCPQDNTIAVSNGGKIITAVNSYIGVYDSNTWVSWQTFTGLVNHASLSSNLCDPQLLYDNVADRFIFVCITCDGSSTGDTVVACFSKTNDPNGSWWVYTFTGNVLNDNSWLDYPKIAISNDELFITGNLFKNTGPFNQSVVYQIDKAKCYSGLPTSWVHWSSIPGSPFTLLPVSYGQTGSYGPGIYLVSTVSTGGSHINLYQITNNQYNSPVMNYYSVSTTAYSVAGQAQMPATSNPLDNGDNRALNGFYLNGYIHFVFCSNDPSNNGWNCINYNRLNVSTQTNTSMLYTGQAGSLDVCYPAVASYSSSPSDKTVGIACVSSSSSVYPQGNFITVTNAGSYTSFLTLKQGYNNVDGCYDANHGADRWGDYTGIARHYNCNDVWTNTSFGDYANQYWSSWIAQVAPLSGISCPVPLDIANHNSQNMPSKVYPNPSSGGFSMDFVAAESGSIQFNLFDETGKLVKALYSGYVTKGGNTFSFHTGSLPAGIYFLTYQINGNTIGKTKIEINR